MNILINKVQPIAGMGESQISEKGSTSEQSDYFSKLLAESSKKYAKQVKEKAEKSETEKIESVPQKQIDAQVAMNSYYANLHFIKKDKDSKK